DADEPDPARAARPVVCRQPDAVVAHLEPELVSPRGETHPHALRVRVSGDVGERLLDDAVDRRLDLLRQALREPLGGELGRDLVPSAEDLDVRLERARRGRARAGATAATARASRRGSWRPGGAPRP